MVEQEYHEMVLDSVHPSGAEEWYCPTCGRRFLMQWPPVYNKVILEAGDETAIHSGGKGTGGKPVHSDRPDGEQVAPEGSLEQVDTVQEALDPWLEWMESVDFERLWVRDLK